MHYQWFIKVRNATRPHPLIALDEFSSRVPREIAGIVKGISHLVVKFKAPGYGAGAVWKEDAQRLTEIIELWRLLVLN